VKIRFLPLAVALGVVLALGAAPAALAAESRPTIEGESVFHVTPTDAILAAGVNPGGLETDYKFHLEYGCGISPDEVCPAICLPEWESCSLITSIPLPGAKLPPSSEVEEVTLDLNEVGVTLKPNTKYRYWIEASNSAGTAESAREFFTTPASASPLIESESASNVSLTGATLEAQINPESTEHNAIYQFQVALKASEFRPRFACPTEEFPAGTSLCILMESQPGALPFRWLTAGTEGKPISLDLAQAGMALQPNTTYHYRVIAAQSVLTVDVIDWAEPIVYGADKTFKTAGSPPLIESESVSKLSPTDATFEAVINPGELDTSYEFHLLKRWKCEEIFPPCEPPIFEIPLPEGQLPASDENQRVWLDLNSAGVSLAPGHDFYEFWVTATNSAGSAAGPAQTFTTPEKERGDKEPPLHDGSSGALQGEETALPPPSPAGGPVQDSPKATPCRRSAHRHHAKHHRHRRAGIGKACSSA